MNKTIADIREKLLESLERLDQIEAEFKEQKPQIEVSKAEAARRLGVHASTVTRLVKEGKLTETASGRIYTGELLDYQRGNIKPLTMPSLRRSVKTRVQL